MISSQKLQMTHKDVPAAWAFEFYCKIPTTLTGEKYKIKSLFNNNDTNPSMVIYYDEVKKSFRFKCFSSGNSGDHLDLVMKLYNLDYRSATSRMVNDYDEFIRTKGDYNVEQSQYAYNTYKVTDFKMRAWNTDDKKMWVPFNIGSKLLEKYCVVPLEYYVMDKNGSSPFSIRSTHLYGYFKKDGTLYKIYQPRNVDRKFIKVDTWVTGYIQGSEQLAGHSLLVIQSSLKDILSVASLKLKVDLIAPDSENTMIPKAEIERFRQQYPYIGVMLDNDKAGIEAMERYRDEYGIPPILLPMSKDPSDSIRDFGASKVRNRIIPLLDGAMNHFALAA